MWTPPDGKRDFGGIQRIECFHMSGLLMWVNPLALMQSAGLFPITNAGFAP
jgi:hypothetical protein